MSSSPGHRARKRFGQHFLHDRRIVNRILDALDPRPGETLVEIGPGLGALTRPLLERVPHLHVVELDRDLVARLRSDFPPDRLSVHQADALKFDFCELAADRGKLRLVGNLPYNISTPILFHLLDQKRCIADLLFMLQKEVVDRMRAPPDCREYGRLSVMIQTQLKVEKLFDVHPGAFTPPPRVESSVVRLVPHAAAPVEIGDPQRFARLVQAAFAHRRKTLHNNLKGLLPDSTLIELGVDPGRRAETLSLAEFATLARAIPAA